MVASPQVRTADTADEAGFVVVRNVPVFAEHETTARNGQRLKFGRNELAAIVERCNRRIRETNDYATVTIGHTSEPGSGATPPPVIGFAGPFRLGTIGPPERQRYAILADFRVYKEDAHALKRYPRRSPELWLEDKYEEMFLDPIALLGAEAPRLDMGLLYSAARGGRLVERYAAASPGAMNAFVPGQVDRKSRYAGSDVSGANTMPLPTDAQPAGGLSPEAINQIIEALRQTDVWQFVEQQMMAGGGQPGADAGGMPGAPGAPAPAPAMPAPAPAPAPAAGPPAPDAGGAPDDGGGFGDDSEPKKYGAGEVPGGDVMNDPAPGEGDVLDGPSPAAGGYDKGGPEKFSARDQLVRERERYNKLQQRVVALEAREADANRRAVLVTMAHEEGFLIDPAKLMEKLCYSKVSNKEFENHIAILREHGNRIPIGDSLPALGQHNVDGPEQYSKRRESDSHSQEARRRCEAAVSRGETPDYVAVLREVKAGR
jgi:hypothetical protein